MFTYILSAIFMICIDLVYAIIIAKDIKASFRHKPCQHLKMKR